MNVESLIFRKLTPNEFKVTTQHPYRKLLVNKA